MKVKVQGIFGPEYNEKFAPPKNRIPSLRSENGNNWWRRPYSNSELPQHHIFTPDGHVSCDAHTEAHARLEGCTYEDIMRWHNVRDFASEWMPGLIEGQEIRILVRDESTTNLPTIEFIYAEHNKIYEAYDLFGINLNLPGIEIFVRP